MAVRITNWGVVDRDADPYIAPELARPRLVGTVFGHPRKSDGTKVVTSSIIRVNGLKVNTSSGTEYELEGPPCKDYLAWLLENGIQYRPEAPIRLTVIRPVAN